MPESTAASAPVAAPTPATAPATPAVPAAAPAHADAVLVPSSYKNRAIGGRRQHHRIKAILDIAEPYLGVDRSRGEKAWLRSVGVMAPDGTNDGAGSRYVLCTRGATETLLYGTGHARDRQPRYTWTPSASDPLVLIGHLIDPDERNHEQA